MISPFFSIITVVYNDSVNLVKSLNSLFQQTCKEFELVIIDGKSNDDTLLQANRFLAKNDNAIITRILSERDSGIYDAMNKGISLSSGKWILFFNAGDLFYNNDVLATVKSKIEILDCDIIYGNHARGDCKTIIYPPQKINFFTLNRYLGICHQSIFCKREAIQSFNTEYSLISDFVWLSTQHQRRKKIAYVNNVIIVYDLNGKSSNQKALRKELLHFLKRYCYINYLIRYVLWKFKTR